MGPSLGKKNSMRFALIQMNSWVGGVADNQARIEKILTENSNSSDLFVLPELALVGYPPRDLLAYPHILKSEAEAVSELARLSKKLGIGLLINHCEEGDGARKGLWNAATLFEKGQKVGSVRKQRLPYYDIFEEERFFSPYRGPQDDLMFRGIKLGVFICEDAWDEVLAFGKNDRRRHSEDSACLPRLRNADIIINVSASPFYLEKSAQRELLFLNLAKKLRKPLLYVNSVGAQDDVIFDGRSFASDSNGKILARAAAFREDILFFDSLQNSAQTQSSSLAIEPKWPELKEAICLGIRDYAAKTGFKKLLLGLSGGIDSALVCYLACESLGAANVIALSMPTQFNSEETKEEARTFAKNLGISFQELPIQDSVDHFVKVLGLGPGLTLENLQSRLRGILLMATSAEKQALLLACGNKSELAMGYSTLYGDLCGALLPIGDLYKTEVYGLARWINESENRSVFSEALLLRAPSAELAPNQKDSDSLPEYSVLDSYLEDFIENQARQAYQWKAFPSPELNGPDLFRRHASQEFKRRQSPPVLKLHQRSFGSGWRLPIAKAHQPDQKR